MTASASPPVDGQEAPPRRENKLKAFFRSRSRSRSRSQPTLAPQDPMSAPPPLPLPRHPTVAPSDIPPSSFKSAHRPVSSTTTATHSTITPLPSDSLTNRINGARYAYPRPPRSSDTHSSPDHDQSSVTCDHDSDDHHFPRAETPSSARRMFVLHSLFGISLTRRSSSSISSPQHFASTSVRKGSTSTSTSESRNTSRRRSFRLSPRPSTPKSVEDSSSSKSPYPIPVPSSPLPLSASPRRRSFGLGSQRNTPKSSTSHLPLPHVQSTHPARSHGRRLSFGSERPPHDSAVALPEEPPCRSGHRVTHSLLPDGGARNKGKERERPLPVPDRPLPDFPPSIDFCSHSLPVDPFPLTRSHLSSQPTGYPVLSHLPTVDSVSSGEIEQAPLPSLPLPSIPKIIQTPPTPQRPGGDIEGLPRSADSNKPHTAKGKTVTIAHREQVLVANSHSHADAQRTTSPKGRFTPRIFSGKDLPNPKDGGLQRSPGQPTSGPSDGPAHKPPGNTFGLMRNMTNHRGKLGSFDFERPVSALNKSSSTIDQQGSLPMDNLSSKTRLPSLLSLERTISADSARAGMARLATHLPGQKDLPMIKADHTGETSVVSFSSLSVQTKSTGKGVGSSTPPGHSSSWGHGSGRRVMRTSHGTFAFENPSSAPGSPNPQAFNLPSEANQNDIPGHIPGLAGSRPKATTPLYAVFDARVKHSRGQSYNLSDHNDPDYPKPSERKSKGKGRSLDLGLGLSWAPSRVREEVLMPGFLLAREKAKLEKSKTNGSDVTNVFESLLSESRFQTFKKYVHRFDAHIIPLEGPSGLLARVERLLAESGLGEGERAKLMSEFTSFVESHNE